MDRLLACAFEFALTNHEGGHMASVALHMVHNCQEAQRVFCRAKTAHVNQVGGCHMPRFSAGHHTLRSNNIRQNRCSTRKCLVKRKVIKDRF